MAVSTAELSKLVETVLVAAKKAEGGDSSEQGRALDGLKVLRKQKVNTKALAETQAGKRIKSLGKHPQPDVAAAAAAVVAAWKDAVRQEAEGSARSTAGEVASRAVSVAGLGSSSRAASQSNLGNGSSKPAQQAGPTAQQHPSSQQTVAAGSAATAPTAAAAAVDFSSIPRTGDSIRDKCRQNLATAFQLAVNEGVAGQPAAAAVAVEDAIFQQNGGVTQAYKAKFRNLHFNLKDPANPDLRRKVLSGDISASQLVLLPPEELASDAKKEENQRIREKKLFDSAPSAAKQATTDQFQCGKCRQRKTTYYQMQTRSADEPMTTFVTCLNCNNRWKFC